MPIWRIFRQQCKALNGQQSDWVLSVTASQNIDDFRYFFSLLGLVPARDCVFDAVADMIAKNFLFSATKRRSHGRNLRHYVNAVTILVNHARQASHLPFNAIETFLDGSFGFCMHA
jgi:hypothetical protein